MSANPATKRDATQHNLRIIAPPADLAIQKQRALQLLLEGKSASQVAEMIGVDRTTIYRWLKEPSFIAERNRQANELRDAAQSRLHALVGKSIEVVERQLAAGNLKAALAVLKSTGMMALEKPDTETDECRLVKREVERLAMDAWTSLPFTEQEVGVRPFHRPEFKNVVQMIDDELQAQYKPKPSEFVVVIDQAADREAERVYSISKRQEQLAQRQAKKIQQYEEVPK